jgi:hypothetical protein
MSARSQYKGDAVKGALLLGLLATLPQLGLACSDSGNPTPPNTFTTSSTTGTTSTTTGTGGSGGGTTTTTTSSTTGAGGQGGAGGGTTTTTTGVGGAGGQGGAPPDCNGPNNCYKCPPLTEPQFLNHCTAAQCSPFDNVARLPLYNNGNLPAIP